MASSAISTKENRLTLAIKFEKGRRFRYGRTFAVALEPDDPAEGGMITAPPELLSSPVVKVRADNIPQREVGVAVSVGKLGRVIWVHPRTIHAPVDDDIWKQVESAVAEFRFRPAQGPAGPATENAVINVVLVSMTGR